MSYSSSGAVDITVCIKHNGGIVLCAAIVVSVLCLVRKKTQS